MVKAEGSNDGQGPGRYISEEHYQELIGKGNKASTSVDFQAHMTGSLHWQGLGDW